MIETKNVEIVDAATAAAYLNLSPVTLARMRMTGAGPKYLKFGRAVRYQMIELQNWIASQQHSHTTEYAS